MDSRGALQIAAANAAPGCAADPANTNPVVHRAALGAACDCWCLVHCARLGHAPRI